MPTTEELPVDPVTGLSAIGLVAGRLVWPVWGAADDDDDDVGMDLEGGKGGKKKPAGAADDADEDETDDADTADDDAEWKPPTQEEWEAAKAEKEKMQAALDKAKDEAKTRREALQKARRDNRTATQKAQASGDKDDQDAADATAQAEATAMAKFKPVAVRSAAVAALLKAKFQNPTEARLTRMVRRLDMDDLDVDMESGEIDGLDEQIADLVDEFPELFTEAAAEDDTKDRDRDRPGRRAGRIAGADKKNTRPEPKTTGEKHAQRLMGGNR